MWQVSVSPSGPYAVSAGNDKVCIVWDLRTYTQLHRLPHDEPVFAAHITSDDRRVVTAAAATLSLWDLSRGVRLRMERPGLGWIRDLNLTNSGQAIFGSDDGAVGQWSLDDGRHGITIAIQASSPIACLAYVSDGDIAVTGYRSEFSMLGGLVLEAWHLPTGSSRWQSCGREVNSIAVMNRGQTLVVGSGDGTVQSRDSATGKLQHSFQTTHWWADGVAVTPNDQYVIAGGVDGRVRVWDATAKELVAELKGHRNVVRTTVALPDLQRLMSGSDDHEDDEDLILRAEDIATRQTRVTIRLMCPSGHVFGSPGSSGHRRRRPVAFTEEPTSAGCGSETLLRLVTRLGGSALPSPDDATARLRELQTNRGLVCVLRGPVLGLAGLERARCWSGRVQTFVVSVRLNVWHECG